jgi:hypothetical protein
MWPNTKDRHRDDMNSNKIEALFEKYRIEAKGDKSTIFFPSRVSPEFHYLK